LLVEGNMNVELNEVTRDASGWQQTVSYEHDGRKRREIFREWSQSALRRVITDRVKELERRSK
jgi:hypothetical protein